MYPNLEAELKRGKHLKKDLASFLKINVSTLAKKLNGTSKFTYDEAYVIYSAFFNGRYELSYLFAKEN